MKTEIEKTLQMFVQLDFQIHGYVTQSTIDAIKMQCMENEFAAIIKQPKSKFAPGEKLFFKYYTPNGYITKDTPFTVEEIKIRKVIPPVPPCTAYSEYRYDYESIKQEQHRQVPAFSGNIGEQLLTNYQTIKTTTI